MFALRFCLQVTQICQTLAENFVLLVSDVLSNSMVSIKPALMLERMVLHLLSSETIDLGNMALSHGLLDGWLDNVSPDCNLFYRAHLCVVWGHVGFFFSFNILPSYVPKKKSR